MKKKYLYVFFLFLSLILLSCQPQKEKKYLIEGKLNNLTVNEIYVVCGSQSSNDFKVDTIQCKPDGGFSFEGTFETVIPILFYFEKGSVWTTVWVKDNDKVTISGDIKYPELILAKGGAVNDVLSKFKEQNKEVLKQRRDLKEVVNNDESDDDSIAIEMPKNHAVSKISNLNYVLRDKADEYIKSNPESFASLVLFQDFILPFIDMSKAREYLDYMGGVVTESDFFKELSGQVDKAIDRALLSKVGSKAPAFSVITTKKDTLTLDSFKGKYILLCFSASWCEYCPEENRQLVNLRKEISAKTLGLLTIALDEDKNAWLKIAKEQQISWAQSVDTTGWRSVIAYEYNIDAIPANILISPDQIIIGRDLSTDSILTVLRK